jgi:hypothetical protein
MQKDLAFGDEEMMKELQERVQKLLDDPQIQELLVNYNLKKLELESNVNITRYDQERKKIWKNVDVEGQRINGTCHKCSKDYLDSLFHKPIYETYIGGVTVMGDVFEGIQNATIINKSWVEDSFNKVKKEYNEETSKALLNVAEFIEKSNDHAAGSIFNSFTEELNKPQPDKSKLKSSWEGIERLLPSIATVSASVAKVVTLF